MRFLTAFAVKQKKHARGVFLKNIKRITRNRDKANICSA
ncbi:hypothetical protein FM107_11815 [Sphingobacterium sp. JB170]|nr:hypothetical protein FM107_11815 [Sphingobacterium sp. JB170]